MIKNRGINPNNQQPMTSEFTFVWWGAYAETCCLYIPTGRAISALVAPRTRSIDTGRVKANGKKEIYRVTDFHVRAFEFGADSLKELVARLDANLLLAKQQGILDQNSTLSGQFLAQVKRPAKVPFVLALAEQTGMYGNARVFVKGRGWIGPGAAVPAGVAVNPATVPTGVDEVSLLQARIAEINAQKAQEAAAVVAAGGIPPAGTVVTPEVVANPNIVTTPNVFNPST
jgi:hypothetical protein